MTGPALVRVRDAQPRLGMEKRQASILLFCRFCDLHVVSSLNWVRHGRLHLGQSLGVWLPCAPGNMASQTRNLPRMQRGQVEIVGQHRLVAHGLETRTAVTDRENVGAEDALPFLGAALAGGGNKKKAIHDDLILTY